MWLLTQLHLARTRYFGFHPSTIPLPDFIKNNRPIYPCKEHDGGDSYSLGQRLEASRKERYAAKIEIEKWELSSIKAKKYLTLSRQAEWPYSIFLSVLLDAARVSSIKHIRWSIKCRNLRRRHGA